MNTNTITNNALKALDAELLALGSDYPRNYGLYQGLPLGQFDRANVYSFTAPPVSDPDGNSVILEIGDLDAGGTMLSASVVGFQGRKIILAAHNYSGLEAMRPAFRHETGLMLVELRKRLNEIKKAKSANPQLLEKLFAVPDPGTAATGPGVSDTEMDVVNAVLRQEVSLLWTPPGTNQDGVIAACAQRHAAQGDSVLILTPTTAQIDAFTQLLATGPAAGSITRVGAPMPEALAALKDLSPSSIARQREPQLFQDLDRVNREIAEVWKCVGWRHPMLETRAVLDKMEHERKQLEQRVDKAAQAVINSASIMLSTLGRAVSHEWVYGRPYDVVIISGVHRALLPQVVWAASLAKKAVILPGDFRQSPNSVTSRSDEAVQWLKRNIFEATGIVELVNAGGWDARLSMLRTQHTTHPQIARITNEVSYGGRLVDAPEAVEQTASITAQPPEPGQAVVFYDVGHLLPHAHAAASGGSHSNVLTAALSFRIVGALLSKTIPSILLATPYGDQAKIHRAYIRDADLQEHVTTTTLHRCVHPQHDVLILDLVDTAPLQRVGPPLKGGWGSESMHQLNAVLTSGRGKILMVGDWGLLQQTLPEDAVMRRFLDEMMRGGGLFKPFPIRSLIRDFPTKNLAFYYDAVEAWRCISEDIRRASHRVIWNRPFANADEVFNTFNQSRMYSTKPKLALALAVENPARHPLAGQGLNLARSIRSETAVQIDDDIFWLIGNGVSAGASRPFVRVQGERAALQISDLFGLNAIIPSDKSRPWVTRKARVQREGVRS